MAQRMVVGVDEAPNGVIHVDVRGAVNRKIPLTAVGDGKTQASYTKEQQIINYLDTLKDGANIQIVQGVSLYPEAMDAHGNYPAPWKKVLHGFETNILDSQKQFLNRTTWTKVARGTPLDQPKEYNQIFWESGLGYTVFVANPGTVQTMKTFGSYIDPLEKQNADYTWPAQGGTIELTPEFMELMGFGPSSVIATTGAGGRFQYELKVACGDACRPAPHCDIVNRGGAGGDPNMNLFKGNASKAQALASKNKGQDDKIKLLVLKEWGDKLQAIIYFLYTHVGKKATDTPTIITCDMVVMMYCVMLHVPCIYTGKESHYFPKPADQDGKYYSIVEYKPSKTPEKDARKRYIYTRNQIVTENKRYIAGLQLLAKNPNTEVYLGGELETFSGAFWKAIADDAQAIETELERRMPLLSGAARIDGETVVQYNQQIDEMKQNYLLIPIVRSSAIKKSKKIKAPTPAQFIKSQLTMSMGQYHTLAREQNHVNLQKVLAQISGVDAVRQSKRPFYDSARIITRLGMRGGGGSRKRSGRYVQGQRGGAPIPPEIQMREFPPFNDEAAPYYTDLASDGLPDKFDVVDPGYVDSAVSNEPAAQIANGAVFEPSDPGPGEGLGYSSAPGEAPAIDLQTQFDLTLENSVEQYVEVANKEHPGIINYGYNLHMTFESLLVYYAAYANQAPIEITPDDLMNYQKEFLPDLFEPELPIGEAATLEPLSPEPVATGMREGRGMGVRQGPYRTPSASSREGTASPPIGSPLAGTGESLDVFRADGGQGVVTRWSAPRGRSGISALSPGVDSPLGNTEGRFLAFKGQGDRDPETMRELRLGTNIARRKRMRTERQIQRLSQGAVSSGGGTRRRNQSKRSKSKTKRTGKKRRTTAVRRRRTQRKTRK